MKSLNVNRWKAQQWSSLPNRHTYDEHIQIIMQRISFLMNIVLYTKSTFLPFTNLPTLISRLIHLIQDFLSLMSTHSEEHLTILFIICKNKKMKDKINHLKSQNNWFSKILVYRQTLHTTNIWFNIQND